MANPKALVQAKPGTCSNRFKTGVWRTDRVRKTGWLIRRSAQTLVLLNEGSENGSTSRQSQASNTICERHSNRQQPRGTSASSGRLRRPGRHLGTAFSWCCGAPVPSAPLPRAQWSRRHTAGLRSSLPPGRGRRMRRGGGGGMHVQGGQPVPVIIYLSPPPKCSGWVGTAMLT